MPVIAGTEKLLVSDTAGSKVTLPEQSPGDSPSEIVSNVVDDDVLKQLLQRIDKAEFRVLTMLDSSKDDPVDRVKKDLSKKNVFSSVLVKVAANYYEKSLLERAKTLNCFVSQLCKSIIFENTAWYGESDIDDPTNSRYYLVLVQYEAKFDAELLRDVVHRMRKPEDRLPRKRFHFQLAPESISIELGGFDHNAVCPFGLRTYLPIVICDRCVNVKPPYLFMGGGKVDVKLGISVTDFLRSTNAIIGTVSVQRIQDD